MGNQIWQHSVIKRSSTEKIWNANYLQIKIYLYRIDTGTYVYQKVDLHYH